MGQTDRRKDERGYETRTESPYVNWNETFLYLCLGDFKHLCFFYFLEKGIMIIVF